MQTTLHRRQINIPAQSTKIKVAGFLRSRFSREGAPGKKAEIQKTKRDARGSM